MTRIQLIQDLAPRTMAEVGVCEGVFSEQLAAIRSIRQLWLIDPWKFYPGPYESDPVNVDQAGQDQRHERVVRKFLKQRGRVKIIRQESLQAVKWFADGALDAAFIDANHTEEAVYADLCAWSRVAKALLCHDYTDSPEALAMGFGVKPAVRRFCEEHDWMVEEITDEPDWPTALIVRQ